MSLESRSIRGARIVRSLCLFSVSSAPNGSAPTAAGPGMDTPSPSRSPRNMAQDRGLFLCRLRGEGHAFPAFPLLQDTYGLSGLTWASGPSARTTPASPHRLTVQLVVTLAHGPVRPSPTRQAPARPGGTSNPVDSRPRPSRRYFPVG